MQMRKRKKQCNSSWRIDTTYISIKDKWFYLYIAVNKLGNTVGLLLMARKDTIGAKTF